MQRRRLLGYGAGILAGISYGTNPLFAKPLLESGVPVLVMLFFRYGISALMLGLWMLSRGESFRLSWPQFRLLAVLGLLFAGSSLALFASYLYIPSGLATTLIYLYPVFVALIMAAMRYYPSWQTWLSILASFVGIILLSEPSGGAQISLPGIGLAVTSALCYALYLVIVNRSRRIKQVSEHTLTFYALLSGTFLFALLRLGEGGGFTKGIHTSYEWVNLLGLALIPTMISLLTIAISSRYVGPTKTSILGVFEPLTAILIGTFLFGEAITGRMALGIAICVAAVVFMILKPGKAPAADAIG